ncbi:hypothetical protein DDJ46_11775 [Mycobacteroides abscessus]|nr:hypothetical protein DDJ46_11775 [Mycobacteroides abscessus]
MSDSAFSSSSACPALMPSDSTTGKPATAARAEAATVRCAWIIGSPAVAIIPDITYSFSSR